MSNDTNFIVLKATVSTVFYVHSNNEELCLKVLTSGSLTGSLETHGGTAACAGPGGPPKILVGWATIHLAHLLLARSLYSLILRKISKIGATRCRDFKAKMHKIRFPLGLCPRPRWRAYSAPLDRLAVFKGPTSKGRD